MGVLKKLKEWQLLRYECGNCYNKKVNNQNEGLWCKLSNSKCTAQTCSLLNNPSISNKKNVKISFEGDISSTLTLPTSNKERQNRVLELYQEGYGYHKISRLLNISKQSTKELIIRAIRNCENKENLRRVPLTIAKGNPLTLRLHNDEFSIKVLVDYNSINLPVTNRGRNLEYKLVFSDSHFFIKLHRNNTLTFRFKDDVIGLSEDEVFDKANSRLVDFINNFNYSGIVLVSKEKILSRHYGLLGSDLARKVHEDRTQVIIRDENGKIRLRIDFSHDVPEVDAESIKTGKQDINNTREYLQDLIDKPHYLPSELKINFDTVMAVQNAYAENIKKHLDVLDDIKKGIKDLSEAVKK